MSNEHESNQESRWKKPNLYSTIVGLYLLVVGGLASSTVIYLSAELYYIFFIDTTPRTMGGDTIGIAFYYIGIFVFTIFAIPSIIVGISLLKMRKRTHFALVIITISILLWTCLFLWVLSEMSQSTSITWLQIFLLSLLCIPIGVSATTYIFLAKAHRHVQWKSP